MSFTSDCNLAVIRTAACERNATAIVAAQIPSM